MGKHSPKGQIVLKRDRKLEVVYRALPPQSALEEHLAKFKELYPADALVGFQGRRCADVVQPNCCHPFLLEVLLFQWPSIRRCASRTMVEHKTLESNKSVGGMAQLAWSKPKWRTFMKPSGKTCWRNLRRNSMTSRRVVRRRALPTLW